MWKSLESVKQSTKELVEAYPWTLILGGLAILTLFLGIIKAFAPQKNGPSYSVQSVNGGVSRSGAENTSDAQNSNPAFQSLKQSEQKQYGQKQSGEINREIASSKPLGTQPGETPNSGLKQAVPQGPVLKNSKYQLKGGFVRPSR